MRTIGVLKERTANETRVALVPEVAKSLAKKSMILVEEGAGIAAGFADLDYQQANAKIVTRKDLSEANCLLAINGAEFFDGMDQKDKLLISFFDPYFQAQKVKRLREINASVMALELVPRISRAQAMDALSSQANIAGYAAVVLAASKLMKVMPLMMTAAGTIKPAKVLILGAGVAGLQAIATAKRLGAVVHAFDVRSAVKEQVESLGGKFLEIKQNESGEGGGGYAKALSESSQQELREKLTHFAKDMDVIIATAQIPGRKAPLLLDESIFSAIKHDAIIIDMAASSGGNVTGSVLGEWVFKNKVSLYGASNLACMMPKDASFTFSKNIEALLEHIDKVDLDIADEILSDALICHRGMWVNKSYSHFIEQQ